MSFNFIRAGNPPTLWCVLMSDAGFPPTAGTRGPSPGGSGRGYGRAGGPGPRPQGLFVRRPEALLKIEKIFMRKPLQFLSVFLWLPLALVLYSPVHSSEVKRLNVVTTVAPITSIVQNVGAGYVDVTGIVPDGTDSHTFEPVPSDAKILAAADIVIVNGLDLELPTVKLTEKVKRAKTPVVRLGDRTLRKEDWQYDFSFPREHGHPNPHLWPNIALAMRYAEITRDSLIALDPQNKEGYIANTVASEAGQRHL